MAIIKRGIVPDSQTISWMSYPQMHAFKRAQDYLKLITSLEKAVELMERLQENYELRYCRPGEILRAAALFPPVFPSDEFNKVIRDINSKVHFDPILLVRDEKNRRLHIADGFQVVTAAYFLDREATVPCHVTAWDLA